MKLATPKLFLVATCAALVFAGCTKKPDRPHPGATVLGPQGGGPNIATGPVDASFGQNTTGLVDRGSDFDPNGHNRTALQAQTVLFDFDKSDIKGSEREKLKVAKEYLDKNPTHRLLLEGHCDWRGTAEYNLGLGDRRANATRKYLQSIGVPPDRMETLSKGSLEAAKNADEATMAKDRRVDLIVVNPAMAAAKPL
jgi:peptidoglycan-associated lipoprotein